MSSFPGFGKTNPNKTKQLSASKRGKLAHPGFHTINAPANPRDRAGIAAPCQNGSHGLLAWKDLVSSHGSSAYLSHVCKPWSSVHTKYDHDMHHGGIDLLHQWPKILRCQGTQSSGSPSLCVLCGPVQGDAPRKPRWAHAV